LAVADVLREFKKKEYLLNFRREAACLYCSELRQWILPENFNIDDQVYVEEMEMPDADRMIYAISLVQGPKGYLIDACNVYMDNISAEMMEKLKPNQFPAW